MHNDPCRTIPGSIFIAQYPDVRGGARWQCRDHVGGCQLVAVVPYQTDCSGDRGIYRTPIICRTPGSISPQRLGQALVAVKYSVVSRGPDDRCIVGTVGAGIPQRRRLVASVCLVGSVVAALGTGVKKHPHHTAYLVFNQCQHRPAYCNELLCFCSVCDECLFGGLECAVVFSAVILACGRLPLGLGAAGLEFCGLCFFICFGGCGVYALSPCGYFMVMAVGGGHCFSGGDRRVDAPLARGFTQLGGFWCGGVNFSFSFELYRTAPYGVGDFCLAFGANGGAMAFCTHASCAASSPCFALIGHPTGLTFR